MPDGYGCPEPTTGTDGLYVESQQGAARRCLTPHDGEMQALHGQQEQGGAGANLSRPALLDRTLR